MIWIAIAIVVSILTAIQLIPETYRAIRIKNLKSISITTFSIISLSSFLWILHGVHNHDNALVFANIVTFICAGTIVLLKLKKK